VVLKQYNCTILTQKMQLFCNITTGIPKNRITEVMYRFKELHNVEIKKLV
jgi:hypothetical protein